MFKLFLADTRGDATVELGLISGMGSVARIIDLVDLDEILTDEYASFADDLDDVAADISGIGTGADRCQICL